MRRILHRAVALVLIPAMALGSINPVEADTGVRPPWNDISGRHGGLPLQFNEPFGSQAFAEEALTEAATGFVTYLLNSAFLARIRRSLRAHNSNLQTMGEGPGPMLHSPNWIGSALAALGAVWQAEESLGPSERVIVTVGLTALVHMGVRWRDHVVSATGWYLSIILPILVSGPWTWLNPNSLIGNNEAVIIVLNIIRVMAYVIGGFMGVLSVGRVIRRHPLIETDRPLFWTVAVVTMASMAKVLMIVQHALALTAQPAASGASTAISAALAGSVGLIGPWLLVGWLGILFTLFRDHTHTRNLAEFSAPQHSFQNQRYPMGKFWHVLRVHGEPLRSESARIAYDAFAMVDKLNSDDTEEIRKQLTAAAAHVRRAVIDPATTDPEDLAALNDMKAVLDELLADKEPPAESQGPTLRTSALSVLAAILFLFASSVLVSGNLLQASSLGSAAAYLIGLTMAAAVFLLMNLRIPESGRPPMSEESMKRLWQEILKKPFIYRKMTEILADLEKPADKTELMNLAHTFDFALVHDILTLLEPVLLRTLLETGVGPYPAMMDHEYTYSYDVAREFKEFVRKNKTSTVQSPEGPDPASKSEATSKYDRLQVSNLADHLSIADGDLLVAFMMKEISASHAIAKMSGTWAKNAAKLVIIKIAFDFGVESFVGCRQLGFFLERTKRSPEDIQKFANNFPTYESKISFDDAIRLFRSAAQMYEALLQDPGSADPASSYRREFKDGDLRALAKELSQDHSGVLYSFGRGLLTAGQAMAQLSGSVERRASDLVAMKISQRYRLHSGYMRTLVWGYPRNPRLPEAAQKLAEDIHSLEPDIAVEEAILILQDSARMYDELIQQIPPRPSLEGPAFGTLIPIALSTAALWALYHFGLIGTIASQAMLLPAMFSSRDILQSKRAIWDSLSSRKKEYALKAAEGLDNAVLEIIATLVAPDSTYDRRREAQAA